MGQDRDLYELVLVHQDVGDDGLLHDAQHLHSNLLPHVPLVKPTNNKIGIIIKDKIT